MNMTTLPRLSVTMKAMASPGRTAWLMASPIMLCLRSTKKQPKREQATAARAPVVMIQVSWAVQLFANSAISGAVFSVAEDGSYVPAEDIAGGEGYWVFVGGESPVVVTVDGAPFALSSFVDGWNLKGVPYETAVPASLQVDAIHSFEAGRYYEHAAESILTIGLGYWIFTPEGGQVVW
mgnify:CR=1 FL=1